MKKVLNTFQKHINTGDLITIAIMLFIAGGAWYLLPEKIDNNREAIEIHIQDQYQGHIEDHFRPLQSHVESNTNRIIDAEGNYRHIRELIEQQQSNEVERYERIQARLDYIINRIDNP